MLNDDIQRKHALHMSSEQAGRSAWQLEDACKLCCWKLRSCEAPSDEGQSRNQLSTLLCVLWLCRGDLQCMAAAAMPIVGTCYINADMLADNDTAMATAIW
jgi:hypothetical protein